MTNYIVRAVKSGSTREGTASTPPPVGLASNPARRIDLSTLSIVTSSLPTAVLGYSYSTTLNASGGAPPLSWSVLSGTLPPGLSLSSAGVISGTPTATVVASVTVRVVDHVSQSDVKVFNLTVEEASNPDFGPRFNDWVLNKSTGAGGDYVDGVVRMPAGTYYLDPFDLTAGAGYAREYDASKPNNNWLTFIEADGPGTVIFDLRPESSQNAYGYTEAQAYGDIWHGGAFRNVTSSSFPYGTAGSYRWCFDGAFTFANGAIFNKQTSGGVRPNRLIFHGTRHYFPIEEWRRQFDIISGIMGIANPGYTIPNTSLYQSVEFNDRFKANYFPTAFRNEGMTNLYILRADIGPCGDDGVFLGGDHVDVVGTVIHEVDDKGVAPDMHHPDVLQSAGGQYVRMLDCTLQGHLNIAAEAGDVTAFIFDRCWQGVCGIDGGSLYAIGHTMNSSNGFGTGAPTTRLSGHFYKGFSNGTSHRDGGAQVTTQYGDVGWHAIMVDYNNPPSGSPYTHHDVVLTNFSVAVPTGCTVDGDGFLTSALSTFLNSTDVPHQQFRAAYTTAELADVMTDYSISFD